MTVYLWHMPALIALVLLMVSLRCSGALLRRGTASEFPGLRGAQSGAQNVTEQ
ncbi:hypothetical protein J7E29_10220 [Streptomyces sp. ISL-90]|nr:hypothetical protein [Streptomyces sp. ISL-90]